MKVPAKGGPAIIVLDSKRPQVKEPTPPPDQKEQQYLSRKRELQLEIEITDLEAKLARIKQSDAFKEKVSGIARIRSDFSEFKSDVLGAQMLEREERERINAQWTDDPDRLEMEHLALDSFMRERGIEPNRYAK